MPITTIFFDLDDTLYKNETGLWDAIRDRMNAYLLEVLRIPAEQVPIIRREYYETYGTTLRGLQKHYEVDTDDFLKFVHDLPLHDYLHPQPEIAKMIADLPQRKFIFTNADDAHAERVLSVMELEDLFEQLIDLRAMRFHCKPEPEAYQIALNIAGNPNPTSCLLIDDSHRNLEPAKAMGFTTVHVNYNGHSTGSHIEISSLYDLKSALPALWATIDS